VKIDLAEVAHVAGAQASHDFNVTIPGGEELGIVGAVRGALTVTNTGRLLVLRGSFRGRVRLQCSRCLELVVQNVEGLLEEEFASHTPGVHAPADTVDQEEPEEAAYAEGMLDLTELLRQQILLNVPLRPVCRPDCRGLCPTCGRDLNEGDCGCPRPGAHGPLAALGRMIDEKRKSRR
jgi:uncharacterized protein